MRLMVVVKVLLENHVDQIVHTAEYACRMLGNDVRCDLRSAVVVVPAVAAYLAVGSAAVDLSCFVLGDVLHSVFSLFLSI